MRKIKKNDQVMVIAGKEKGHTGKVLRVIDDKRVVVEKLNLVKKHQKPTQKQSQGGIVDKESPLDISNVMLMSKKLGKPVRVGFKYIETADGKKKKVRYCRKTDEIFD